MNNQKKEVFSEAFTKTTDSITKLFSPIILFIGIVTDFKKVMGFIFENLFISICFLLLFLIVFIINIKSSIKIKLNEKREDKPTSQIQTNVNEPIVQPTEQIKRTNRKSPIIKNNYLFFGGIVITTFSAIFLIYILTVASNGLYYPIIETIPKDKIEAEVTSINNKLKNSESDLRVTYYCPTNNCSLVPNGVHFSKEEAEKSIQLAKQYIPEHVKEDYWIFSKNLIDTVKDKVIKVWDKIF